jgi:protein-tyrosine phosphatase
MAAALIARHLVRAGVGSGLVQVESAGTHALAGAPTDPPVLAMLEGLGARPDTPHRARFVTENLVDQADLILAMARGHRDWMVREWPAAGRRVFTLRELAGIAVQFPSEGPVPVGGAKGRLIGCGSAGDPVGGIRPALTRVVETASALRGRATRGFAPRDFDVVDPYRRPPEIYRQMAAQLAPAAQQVADWIATHVERAGATSA